MKVLIVEDEAGTREALVDLVTDLGHEVRSCSGAAEARRLLSESLPDVVLTDLMLQDGEGLDVVRAASGLGVGCESVVLTGHGSVKAAVDAMKAGAYDFLLKPLKPTQLEALLGRLSLECGDRRPEKEEGRLGFLVARSPQMTEIFSQLERVARSEASVLITGESGTGKELVARTIHLLSRRREKPFVAVNCGALSPSLVESELFGHERGAFTGAERRRAGVFEAAAGGTLFLDEVTEMSPDLQVKLLRVLENRSFRRVGGNEELDTDVRVLSSSNRDPDTAVERGDFREDLFYRLNVFPVLLPPLRDRPDDIEPLAWHFLAGIDESEHRGIRSLASEATDALKRHSWPGNVRELRNVIHRCYILGDPPTLGGDVVESVLSTSHRQPATAVAVEASPANGNGNVGVKLGDSFAEAERKLLTATLGHVQGNKRRAAELLGVSLKTIYNKLKEFGLEG
ncbi:MAG TPA: sigma-54 dependent transcriptional regulator [Thermoanaerobaculia bacterium]|nr:sigma-54 dependent transcriptional regulator [Thermoanaerobaculia bacterium]